MPLAVSNSSPLIHLSMVGRISLLRRFSSIYIPPAVWQEVVEQGGSRPGTAEIFYRAGLVERYGSGIERMINVLNAASLPLPEIISTPLGFTLTMRKDPFTEEYLQELGLNKRQVAAISFLRVHGTITNSQYQELNAVAARTAVNDLNDLVRKRIAERRGRSRRDTHYILAPGEGGEQGDDAR